MIFKDAYAYAIAEDGSRVDIAHYDPVKKQPVCSEPKCGVCDSPWPASHVASPRFESADRLSKGAEFEFLDL
jgi:hypothetical protein